MQKRLGKTRKEEEKTQLAIKDLALTKKPTDN